MFLVNLDPFLYKKNESKPPRDHFSQKEFTIKNFGSKFQFLAKVMVAPPGGQTVAKKFGLWSTQKYSKASKICLACLSIFFRVSYMFKPTVP